MSDVVVWSRRVIFFHWINAFVVLGLLALGLVMSGETSEIGLSFSEDFRESLVPYHIGLGVLLAINFAVRIHAMFNTSDRGESFDEVNPLNEDNVKQLKEMKSEPSGHAYKYHNPIGRMMVAAWFVVILSQIVTGSLLSYEHLSEEEHVASVFVGEAYAHGVSHSESPQVEQAEKLIVAEEDDLMLEVHELSAYLIIFMLFAHIAGVIKESIRTKTNLTKRMIDGG